jgi:hypothetical protein
MGCKKHRMLPSKSLGTCNTFFLSTLNLRYLSMCPGIVQIAYIIPRHDDAAEKDRLFKRTFQAPRRHGSAHNVGGELRVAR